LLGLLRGKGLVEAKIGNRCNRKPKALLGNILQLLQRWDRSPNRESCEIQMAACSQAEIRWVGQVVELGCILEVSLKIEEGLGISWAASRWLNRYR
jgi:hypothetical protein